MTSVLLVVSASSVWTLRDGTKESTGFWAGELIHPHQVFREAGYDIVVATPGGGAPTVQDTSLRADLNGTDQAAMDAQIAYLAAIDGELSAPAVLEDVDPAGFDVVFVVGGHAPIEDLADHAGLGRIVATTVADPGKVVAAVCHGPCGFLPARAADGSWPFEGRRLTGFTDEEEAAFGYADKVPWSLEAALKQAGATFDGGPKFAPQVVVDGNIVTGQNPASAQASAEAVVRLVAGVPAVN
jgi:putative intracellular protease/amidase